MPVDRPGRDRFAASLAAYMRGEIDNLAFAKATDEIGGGDSTLNRFIFLVYFLYDDFRSHPLGVTEQGWRLLRNLLAFLKTDLERKVITLHRQWLGARHLCALAALAMLGAAFLARAWAWWLPFAAWFAAASVPWAFLRTGDEKARPLDPYFPFETEAQWRQYEYLAEGFLLPAYKPPQRECRSVLERIYCALLMAAVGPVLLLFMLWPKRTTHCHIVGPAA